MNIWKLQLLNLEKFDMIKSRKKPQKIMALFINLDVCVHVCIYKSESKDLQYFDNIRNNLAYLDVFVDAVKVTNHIGLWNTRLAWYSLSATHRMMAWSTALEFTLLLLLNHQKFSSKITWIIWWLYSDQPLYWTVKYYAWQILSECNSQDLQQWLRA